MKITSDSNKTDNPMALKKTNKQKKQKTKQNELIAIVLTILIVIKIVYKPLHIAK